MPPVVLISLDGVRPDALTAASCPALRTVREQGASTLRARGVMPSVMQPCHTSIFHSVPPAQHGITSNIFMPMARLWMSKGYLLQLEHIDSLLADFFTALPSEYTAILHSDHGGHDRSHGTELDEDMLIPWRAVGPRIKKGYTIQSEVTLLDTAPTIVKIMGIRLTMNGQGAAQIRYSSRSF